MSKNQPYDVGGSDSVTLVMTNCLTCAKSWRV